MVDKVLLILLQMLTADKILPLMALLQMAVVVEHLGVLLAVALVDLVVDL